MATEASVIASEGYGGSTTIDDLHPDVLTRALRLLDGPSLAAACCASSHLRFLSCQSELWLHHCLSTWPSLRHPRLLPLLSASPSNFFSDVFPFPFSGEPDESGEEGDLPGELISSVDLYHRGIPFFSRVIETDTSSDWFRGSPFRIDEELTMSWILIDPSRGRAVNASSRRAVAVERQWYTGETKVRFAMVASPARGWMISPVVTFREGTGRVREVGLTVEDMDGACVSGREGLQAVKEAMGMQRKGRGRGEEEDEAKERYVEFLGRRRWRKERMARREGMVDFFCTTVGAAVFLAFLMVVIFR
ncbi:F-box protein [Apostasia shenzhenica]|uniref:F-box protein n=1 Tax=Apostasia shenzhenica TaxID=1088818 RepID=A0A2I0BC81_9ASPA|nr:F-box protein [Apostasia shenzhenica]